MLTWDDIKGRPGIWDLCDKRSGEPLYAGRYATAMGKDGCGELLDELSLSSGWNSQSNNSNYGFKPSQRSLRNFKLRCNFTPMSHSGSKLLLLEDKS